MDTKQIERVILQALQDGRVLPARTRGPGLKVVTAWRTLMSSGVVRPVRNGVELGDAVVPYPTGVRRCIRCHVPMASEHPGHRLCPYCRARADELRGGLDEVEVHV